MDATWKLAFRDVGDVRYGGVWVKDEGDHAEVLEVVELDDSCGKGHEDCWKVAIEVTRIGFYTSSMAQAVKRLRDALEYGVGVAAHLDAENTREQRRISAWTEMARYGLGDRTPLKTLHTPWSGGEDEVWAYLAETHEIERD